MSNPAAVLAKKARDSLLVSSSHGRSPSGVPLPPKAFRMGGAHFASDDDFVASARAEVRRLAEEGLSRESRLLDWGCGAGRMALGTIEEWGGLRSYHGVDVQQHLIRWARRHIQHPGYTFTHVDVRNARYNPTGASERTIPGESAAYDAFYAYSVFSHMGSEDVGPYLGEVARLLAPGGFAFVTAFTESDVEPEAENPAGYGPLTWSGPLHCVRFSQDRWDELVATAGLRTRSSIHGQETDGQSRYVLEQAD
jgi:SAM-dependent methyltransferase